MISICNVCNIWWYWLYGSWGMGISNFMVIGCHRYIVFYEDKNPDRENDNDKRGHESIYVISLF